MAKPPEPASNPEPSRRPAPVKAVYDAMMQAASDPTAPADQRARTATAAGDLVAARAPQSAITAYRLAAAVDPLDGRPAIAAAALNARRGALDQAREEAASAFRASLDEAVRADAAFLLGEIALATESIAEAEDAFAAAAQLFERVHARDRADPQPLHAIARLHLRRADVALLKGDAPAAKTQAGFAAALLDALQARDPADPAIAADARACLDRQVDIAMAEHNALAAAEWLERLLPLAHAAHAAASQDNGLQRNLALARLKHSLVIERRGDVAAAISSAEAAIGLLADLCARERDAPALALDLARALRRRAEIDLAHDEGRLALGFAAQAGGVLDRLMRETPSLAVIRERTAVAMLAGDAALRNQQPAEAEAAFACARDLCAPRQTESPLWREALATACDRLGDVHAAQGVFEAAAQAYAASLRLRAVPRPIAITAAKLAAAQLRAGDPQAALVAARAAESARRALAAAAPDDPAAIDAHATALQRVGEAALAASDVAQAREALEDSLALFQQCPMWTDPAPDQRRRRANLHAALAQIGDFDAHRQAGEAVTLLEALITEQCASAADIALRERLLRL